LVALAHQLVQKRTVVDMARLAAFGKRMWSAIPNAWVGHYDWLSSMTGERYGRGHDAGDDP
jgi:hypothetical protein